MTDTPPVPPVPPIPPSAPPPNPAPLPAPPAGDPPLGAPSAGTSIDRQLQAWGPAWPALAALGLVLAGALLQVAALVSMLEANNRVVDDSWKQQLWVLAGPALVISILLVVAAILSRATVGPEPGHRQVGRMVGPLVLLLAAVVAVVVVLAAIGDLAELGDEFNRSANLLLGRLAVLVLLAVAAGGVAGRRAPGAT
jgi:hypothetical protein